MNLYSYSFVGPRQEMHGVIIAENFTCAKLLFLQECKKDLIDVIINELCELEGEPQEQIFKISE